MGASVGGVQAFSKLLADLPSDFPAAVLIVQHTSPSGPGLLPKVLSRRSSLPVRHPRHGEAIQPAHVYVAPPDHHLLVSGSSLHLSRGPREKRQRPAVDALFRTAAKSYGRRAVGVVLTGYLDDGTAGLAAIKIHGGIAVVQDPDEAEAPPMPRSALRYVPVDHCLRLSRIAPMLVRLASEPAISERATVPIHIDNRRMTPEQMTAKFGPPTPYVCPECHGSLWEAPTGKALQFKCHVGHLYSPESLLAEHKQGLENNLWSVVRTLEERAALLRRLAQREDGPSDTQPDFAARAHHCERQAALVRTVIQEQSASNSK